MSLNDNKIQTLLSNDNNDDNNNKNNDEKKLFSDEQSRLLSQPLHYQYPSDDSLNYPWFIYPGTPFAEYISDEYLPELKRLTKYIYDLRKHVKSNENENKQLTQQILFHLTIGSPMEELGINNMRTHKTLFQMHQIIPAHVILTASYGISVINIIVCPNIVEIPMFMELTIDYVKVADKYYTHKTLPITIIFFTTMMPSKDKKRNDHHMTTFINENYQDFLHYSVETFRQTTYDRNYVDQFYDELNLTLQHISALGGTSTCFSFAVFNNITINRRFNNFAMFRELVQTFEANSHCALICEWFFHTKSSAYVVYDVHDNKQNAISFVPLAELIRIDSNFNSKPPSCWYLVPDINFNESLIFKKVIASKLMHTLS